jgi:hypothetical protein
MPHYVYLYRDKSGRPQYVGYGKRVTRANAHLRKSHNPNLNAFLRKNKKFTIEVCGPFKSNQKSKQIGLIVETALISALNPDSNIHKGQSDARFRPLGVPVNFAKRLSMPVLQCRNFLSRQGGSPKSVLFVKVGDKNFGDGRRPYDPANPPEDNQIKERVEKWWRLSRLASHWAKTPNKIPGLLIGINGSPGSQIVIASLKIDRHLNAWENLDRQGIGIRVPLLSTPKLDAFKLRGCRVDSKAKLAFGSFFAESFILLNPKGRLSGGRRTRK